MVKSYVAFLEGLYTALLAECSREYPQLTSEWRRDLSSLRLAIRKRGIRILTLDHPSFGKHLDRCLASGVLTASGVALFGRRSSRTPIPRLYGGLVLRIFDSNGVLRSDADVHSVRLLRLLCYAGKKIRMECSDESVYKTVSEYFSIEEDMRVPTLDWDGDTLDLSPGSVRLSDGLHGGDHDWLPGLSPKQPIDNNILQTLDVVQQVADITVGGFGLVKYNELRPKHGPGAVADLPRYDVSKYSFPHWPARLENLFPFEEFAHANFHAWEESFKDASPQKDLLDNIHYPHGNSSTQHAGVGIGEVPCVLLAVPKTQKGPRLIAKEPTCNQWIQQALKGDLERKVLRSPLKHCISFRDQSLSGNAALRASLSGLDATIDLSSASDRLSLWAIERVFRSNLDLLRAWHACRTRYLRNEIDDHLPKYIKLRKFAPAGSALTFPVQTIVYSIVAIGTLIKKRGWTPNQVSIDLAARRIRVFGDDLIVPVDICEELTQVLTYLGLKVNLDKTFSKGNFRESCGVDAFRGFDVTPAYVLESFSESRPESLDSVVQSANNFLRKDRLIVADWLRSTVPPYIRKNIPEVSLDSGAWGWASYGGNNYTQRSRWNSELQRMEYQVFAPSTKVERRSIQGWWSLLQYFTEAPPPSSFAQWSSGVDSRPTVAIRRRWVAPS